MRWYGDEWRRRHTGGDAAVAGVTVVAALVSAAPASAAGTPAGVQVVSDPASLVNTFHGTANSDDMFPGASLPFGMMQWSPDTSSRTLGGGYNYSSTSTLGFSLNHASGPGCAVYEDVPILPATGAVPATPDALKSATETFSPSDESARPGQCQVGLGAAPDTINAQLAVTLRSGIGDFSFPAGSQANLIFKSGDSFDRNARRASPGPVNGTAPGITQQMTMYLHTATVPVNPDKTVVSVTLPNVTSAVASRASAMHIFALALGHRGQ